MKLDRLFKPGDAIRARIIKIDPGERKIGLTTRDVQPLTDEERAAASTPHDEHPAEPEGPDHEPVPPETNTNSQS